MSNRTHDNYPVGVAYYRTFGLDHEQNSRVEDIITMGLCCVIYIRIRVHIF